MCTGAPALDWPPERSLHASVYLAATPAPEAGISGQPDTGFSSCEACSSRPYFQDTQAACPRPTSGSRGRRRAGWALRPSPTTQGRVAGTLRPAPRLRPSPPQPARAAPRASTPAPPPDPHWLLRALPPRGQARLRLHVTRRPAGTLPAPPSYCGASRRLRKWDERKKTTRWPGRRAKVMTRGAKREPVAAGKGGRRRRPTTQTPAGPNPGPRAGWRTSPGPARVSLALAARPIPARETAPTPSQSAPIQNRRPGRWPGLMNNEYARARPRAGQG